MPRPPSPESRQVRILSYLDEMLYTLPDDQTEFDLLLRTHLYGPLREPARLPPPGRSIKCIDIRTEEILTLRSVDVMAEDDIGRHFEELDSGKLVQVQMELDYFSSDWNDDQDINDWDLSGRIALHYDNHGRLHVDARFDQDWVLGFGKNLVGKHLDGQEIAHFDLRIWHILSYLSPELDKELRASVGKATALLRHPLYETLQAAHGKYFKLGPPVDSSSDNNKYRDGLLNAMGDGATVYDLAQLCLIFGKENPNRFDPATRKCLVVPARDVTITKLITESGMRPRLKKHYSAIDVASILLPHAAAYRGGERYKALKDEVIDKGIFVPDSPMT